MITLVFSACVAGQLVPCGCSPDQRGGMPRAVAYVEKLRRTQPDLLFIDAGDLLFENPAPPPKQMLTQRRLKAEALARIDELMHPAARALGARDLALGAEFAAQTTVPLLAAGKSRMVREVGILAGSSPEDFTAPARQLRKDGAKLVVLLLHPRGDNAWTAAQSMMPAAREAGVDLVVLGRRDDPASDPNIKEGPLLAVEGHGQSLLRVDVHLGNGPLQMAPSEADKQTELKAVQVRIDRFRAQIELYPQRKEQLEAKIRELEARRKSLAAAPLERPPAGAMWADAQFVPLTQEVGSDAAAQKLVDAYDEKVTELNLAEAKSQPEACPAAARGELAYVGAAKCAECHETEAQFWRQTKHAGAYETLVKVRKQFSLDCIRCHVTGWEQAGGVCRIDRVGERRDVQCEVCHGPGSEHVIDETGGHIKAEVTSTVCMRCHEAANSPHFDYMKYKPFVVGPGHGEPLARGQEPMPRPGGPQQ